MTLTAKATGSNFEKAPAGMHIARCIRLIDLGTQHNKTFDNWQHKIRIYWELPNTQISTGDYAGQPFLISNDYTMSLSDKADLRKHLKSWRGRDFTDQELAGFDLSSILDKCCMLNIIHDGEYANVAAISPLMAGAEGPPRINDLVVFDIEKFDDTVFAGFTENLKKKIRASQECSGHEGIPPQHVPPAQESTPPFDDDVPF